ncbi:hypothetical protein WMY93_006859 [Mugilogobius chulae]|uniref:THAP-type domain-containing protein n=1 Tax=Mugilogobius chulae TaxID=88201 RepID=A0AAW0PPH7_9GOBI
MVKRCAYGLCKSDTRYPERLAGGVEFFAFPKPKTQLERCLQWIKQCGRPYSQLNTSKINKHTYVCSKHFLKGKPTSEFPNPVNAVLRPKPGRKQLRGCRRPTKKRRRVRYADATGSTSSTDDAEESQQYAVDSESPEQPPLSGCQLEEEPEEEQSWQSTEKEKNLEAENNNIKLQMCLQKAEIEALKAQISILKKKTLTPELLQSSEIRSMSDKEIVRKCGIISLLEKLIDTGYLQKGDGIMADKGFLIEEEMQTLGLKLNMPPDVLVTKRIAKHRLHVDRAIAKIKSSR